MKEFLQQLEFWTNANLIASHLFNYYIIFIGILPALYRHFQSQLYYYLHFHYYSQMNTTTPTLQQFGIYHLLLISFSIFFLSILCIPLCIPLYLKGR